MIGSTHYSPLSMDNFVAEFFDKLESILVARSGKNPGGNNFEAGPDIFRMKDPMCFAGAPFLFPRLLKVSLPWLFRSTEFTPNSPPLRED